MRKSRILVPSVALAAVTAGMPHAGASVPDAARVPAVEPLDPGVIGSTTVDQRVPVVLPDLVDQVRKAFGPRYSGLHVEPSSSGPVMVLSLVRPTAADRSTVEAGVAKLQESSSIAIRVRLRAVTRSEADRDRLSGELRKRVGPDAQITYDAGRDILVVAGPTANRFADELPAGVEAQTVDFTPMAYPPGKRPGVRVWVDAPGGGCTSSFLFTVPSGAHMATAGHCWGGAVGNTVRSATGDSGTSAAINPVYGSDGNATVTGSSDKGSYFTPDANWADAALYLNETSSVGIAGTAEPLFGESLCYRGASSATKKCGTVAIVPTAESEFFYMDGDLPIGGDSGSPVFKLDANGKAIIVGIMDGSAGGPGLPTRSYVNSAPRALAGWGGTILTNTAPTK